ncbi:hypothetical protein [Corynebacterium terpenotabidum]|uniref:N-acetyltransferase domain-containing protein n=1 Tax=Corynebacterium terpenotabidum Y-11 TaxID=1200352 RepID=S4XJT3_9CORY|nr:hypothetical protein [Corynebacterium terpenotabidum]AGP32020.1 hypothetical protein A606_11905 [Corynebacterium terpenotabidum Y-11]
MEIRYSALSQDGGAQLEAQASRDVFWELPVGVRPDDAEFDKQMWMQSVLYRWGICGYTAYVGTGEHGSVERPAATVFFAPATYFPGAAAMPSGPASSDAVLVSTVFVDQPYMGLYLEHSLIETVLTEAERRGVKAVEAFGRNDSGEATDLYIPEGYHGWEERPDGTADALEAAPVLSADILEQEGFYVIGPHRRFPRYRKDLHSRSSLFSAFSADAHEMLNDRGPLATVLGGGR